MTSCPECGFEYTPEEGCRVCGFQEEGKGGSPSPHPVFPPNPSRSLRISLSLGILFLVVAVGVYLGTPYRRVLPSASVTGGEQGGTPSPAGGAPRIGQGASTGGQGTLSPIGAPVVFGKTTQATLVPAFDITQRKELPPTDSYERYLQWMLKNTKQTEPFLKAKWERSREILQRQDIVEERVLQAFLMAPREEFCRPYNRKNAYADAAMPIGYGQTISGPHMVSRMTQNLRVEPHHRVLEIGTGSGYQASVLAELSNFVFTIEIVPELTQETDEIYKKLEADYPQYKNIKRKNADGYYGWEEYAPFDRIIVTAGIDHIPPPLLQQLTPGGIMVIPVGPPSGQTVMKVTKNVAPDGSISLEREDIFHGRRKVIFVPFTAGKGEVHSIEKDLQKKDSGKKEQK